MTLTSEGKQHHLPAKDLPAKVCQSAEESLRRIQPEKACRMSFDDNLIEQGHDDEKIFKLSAKAEPVFKGMIEMGITPLELKA